VRIGPGEARTILLVHIISVRPSKQPLMVRTFLKVYMELGSSFLFLQEQIEDIIIIFFYTAIFFSYPSFDFITFDSVFILFDSVFIQKTIHFIPTEVIFTPATNLFKPKWNNPYHLMEIHTKPTSHTNDTHTHQQTGTWSRGLQKFCTSLPARPARRARRSRDRFGIPKPSLTDGGTSDWKAVGWKRGAERGITCRYMPVLLEGKGYRT